MADTKLSALTELAATPANDDEVYIRDVSEAAAAESKRITIANLKAALASVEGLSGLLADDQHVLDAEALAAAVQAGAITNAVTKAPTHDAVFDVKTTADGAIAKSLLTTRGDIIFRNATVPARLAKGSSGDVLTMGASDPAWTAPAGGGPTVDQGTYAGNDANGRQITTGFECAFVIIMRPAAARAYMYYNSGESLQWIGSSNSIGGDLIHASDGFIVNGATGFFNNSTGQTYHYFAISF